MKILHPPLIPPIKAGKAPSPLVGEGLGEGYFVPKLKGVKTTEHLNFEGISMLGLKG